MRLKQKSTAEPATKSSDSDVAAEFPNVRYFHIHFEHLETQLQLALQALNTLQAQVARLEKQLNAAENRADDNPPSSARESVSLGRNNGKKRATARHYPTESNRPHSMNESSFD